MNLNYGHLDKKQESPAKFPIFYYIIQVILAMAGFSIGLFISIVIFGDNNNVSERALLLNPILLAYLFTRIYKRYANKRYKKPN